jgi:hypothetical protein
MFEEKIKMAVIDIDEMIELLGKELKGQKLEGLERPEKPRLLEVLKAHIPSTPPGNGILSPVARRAVVNQHDHRDFCDRVLENFKHIYEGCCCKDEEAQPEVNPRTTFMPPSDIVPSRIRLTQTLQLYKYSSLVRLSNN